MDSFTALSDARIHKKEETKILNNLPSNFVESFYRDWLNGKDFSQETDFQQEIVRNTPCTNVKNIS